MQQYVFIIHRRGEGVFATVTRAEKDMEAKRNDFKIHGICFFRRDESGEANKIATLYDKSQFLDKGFYIDQPKDVGRHKNATLGKNEVAAVDMSNGILCLDADAVGLQGPTYIKVGEKGPSENVFEVWDSSAILAEYTCSKLSISFNTIVFSIDSKMRALREKFNFIIDRLRDVGNRKDFEETAAEAGAVIAQAEKLSDFWEGFSADDYSGQSIALESIRRMSKEYKYKLLDRMRQDCEYYLNAGDRQTKHLWASTERLHILMMNRLLDSFSEEDKPDWIDAETINTYREQMGVDAMTLF